MYGNPVVALTFVYTGFLTQYSHKLQNLIETRRDQTAHRRSTHYIVQCKGESGWFDLELQKFPRKAVLQYPAYKLAQTELNTLIQTRAPLEPDRLRIIKRTTTENVV